MKRTAKELKKICMIRDVAKAIYLLSDLNEVWVYLNAQIDMDTINGAEADLIVDVITDQCKNVQHYQIENFRERLYEIA